MSPFLRLSIGAALIAATGCSFMARGPEDYRNDTAAVLASKEAEIQSCYNDVLKRDKTAEGAVGVKFTVQSETGKIINPEIDPATTTAPEPLGQCVISAINGLTLDPPDERDGLATFVYEFRATPSG